LERLQEFGEGTLDAFFPKKYAYTALWRPLLGLDKPPKITRHIISMNLSRLRREGLVEKFGIQAQKSYWQLTEKGKKKLEEKSQEKTFPRLQKDSILRLVIFDIPERERNKRNNIRAALVGCQFRQLQKSVWIGQYPLPEDFISLIDNLNLAPNIHIFSVREGGTLHAHDKTG
jgi:phenylacetic acid degradation operon negative regulatory protein